MTEQNKVVVRRLFDEVWNGGNLGVIPELYGTDFVAHYRPPADFERDSMAYVRSSSACVPPFPITTRKSD